ncbi:MAG TPA: FAD-dependent oxidoreductase [Candidatus Binatia bacterium]|nr:FAD-dependent oxidoreductase [Candidatus Binatia bacterium]
MPEECDVAVVGAGPAGLSAATLCARVGLRTVCFDDQPSGGGQIFRAISRASASAFQILGPDYLRGARLLRDFESSGVLHVPDATVWSLTSEREIGVSRNGNAHIVRARQVILATGALERPFPIPGWTLPGVMTAGGAQIMLKTASAVPAGKVVLAGCGPLLWLLAWQYLNSGTAIHAILDTTPLTNWLRALPHAAGFASSPLLRKGLALITAVRQRARVIDGVTALRAVGRDRVEAIAYRTVWGRQQELPVDVLLLHQGVIPHTSLSIAAGIQHHWDETQLCWAPVVETDGRTKVDGVLIAGDGAGIAGAGAAEEGGRLAAIVAIKALRPKTIVEESSVYHALSRHLRGRAFLDLLYRPAKQFRLPEGDTIACRCEEVTARQIVEAVHQGCVGPNQMKAFLRCGMGPCQGRLCSLTITELIAEARGVSQASVGHFRSRPPVKPVTLAELAALPKNDIATRAVIRE